MDIEGMLKNIERGTTGIITKDELVRKLEEGRSLNVKFGIDPTSPDIHLGHTVPLQKLKQFQDMGHYVQLIIGDYTARIGDPSGRSETRPMVNIEKITENLKSYTAQVFKILDREKTNLLYNSEWLSKLSGIDMMNLTSKYTVQQLLQRRDFSRRIEEKRPLSVSELLYPLMVGYDSVHLKSDIEIGGTDQLFNFIASRELQAAYGQTPEVIITLPLLEGLDGVKKMSKSLGNAIGIQEDPSEIYGKIMSISDTAMLKYFELISDVSINELETIKNSVIKGTENPMKYKQQLAKEIVSKYHGIEAAFGAENNFNRLCKKKSKPSELERVEILYSGKQETNIVNILRKIGKTSSNSEARRLVEQRGVKVDGNIVTDIGYSVSSEGNTIIQVGKHYYREIYFKETK